MLLETSAADLAEDADKAAARDQRRRYVKHRPAFILEYQPVIELRSGRVSGIEALPRRPARPRIGVPPSAFVHSVDRSDIGEAIGWWALAQACVEARYWPDYRVSMNVSARQLESGVMLAQVDDALKMSGLAPARLDIELSASSHLAPETVAALDALRDQGVGLVLDDVGASLTLVRQMKLRAIKLDGALVRELPLSGEACETVRALLDAGHSAGLVVVAEGVETLAQLDFLVRIGCDQAQGPLYSRPLPPDRLTALLDYGVDTCSGRRSTPETPYERSVP